jgi:putative NADH-flavin reductase
MKLCVFGANGQTGRLLVRQALDEGHVVTAVTRHPGSFPLRHPALRIEAGDVADPAAVEKVVTGQDAVLSSLGVPFGRHPVSVYSAGASAILAAMTQAGVDRFVAVTSSAIAPDPEPVGGFFFRKVLQPLVVSTLGRTTYADQRQMEEIVRASSLDWTIVRPSGLFSAPGVSDYLVRPEYAPGRFTSRPDLADCLLREAGRGGHHRQAIGVATTEGQPGILALIWREGIRKPGRPAPGAITASPGLRRPA